MSQFVQASNFYTCCKFVHNINTAGKCHKYIKYDSEPNQIDYTITLAQHGMMDKRLVYLHVKLSNCTKIQSQRHS